MKKLTNESSLSIEDVYFLEMKNNKMNNDKKSTKSTKRFLSAFDSLSVDNRTYLVHHLTKKMGKVE